MKITNIVYTFINVLLYYKKIKMLQILSALILLVNDTKCVKNKEPYALINFFLLFAVHFQLGYVLFRASIHLEQTWTYNFVYRQAISLLIVDLSS